MDADGNRESRHEWFFSLEQNVSFNNMAQLPVTGLFIYSLSRPPLDTTNKHGARNSINYSLRTVSPNLPFGIRKTVQMREKKRMLNLSSDFWRPSSKTFVQNSLLLNLSSFSPNVLADFRHMSTRQFLSAANAIAYVPKLAFGVYDDFLGNMSGLPT